MAAAKNNEYVNVVSNNNEYITPENARGKRISATLNFFPNMIRILIYSNRQAVKGIYDAVRWSNSSTDIRESLEKAGVKMHFEGMDNIRKAEGPAVFVGNHMTTLETVVLPSIIQPVKNVLFVIKEELIKYPVFGPVCAAREPILVGRENPREDLKIVLEEGSDKLSQGKSVIIFPQRTRSLVFDAESFNSLGNKLAKRNNVPVIPIALVTDAWGNGKFIKEAGKIDASKTVHFAFGEPMYIKGNGAEEHNLIIKFISGKMKEWGREDLLKPASQDSPSAEK
jgi:1-acyl-sn-glycerol-3-phosphate acyltransferase